MNLLGKTIILGSSSSPKQPQVQLPSSSGKQCNIPATDYSLTGVLYDKDVITVTQNPGVEFKAVISDFEPIRRKLYDLHLNKADKTVNIIAGDGLTGGGTLDSSDIYITLAPSQDHIAVSEDGVFIKNFTETTSGGIVPTPPEAWADNEHVLTADGKWSKLNVFRCYHLNQSTGFPTSGVNLGNIAIIGDEDLTDPKTQITYKPHTVLVYTKKGWEIIGYSTLNTKWIVTPNESTLNLSNSYGDELNLPFATKDNAGVITAQHQHSIDVFNGVTSIDQPISSPNGLDILYKNTKFDDLSIDSGVITIPLATDKTNGLINTNEKIKLNHLPDGYKDYTLSHEGEDLYLVEYTKDSSTGDLTVEKIEVPLATYTDTVYTNGLLSGQDKLKLDNIESYVTTIQPYFNANKLNLEITHRTPNDSTEMLEYVELPVSTDELDGLMSHEDKYKLNHLDQFVKASDFLEENPDSLAYIKNKPTALTLAGVEYALVPSTLNVKDKQVKVLNANGEWINVSQIPPITISSEEPIDPKLKIDGAIWIKVN